MHAIATDIHPSLPPDVKAVSPWAIEVFKLYNGKWWSEKWLRGYTHEYVGESRGSTCYFADIF